MSNIDKINEVLYIYTTYYDVTDKNMIQEFRDLLNKYILKFNNFDCLHNLLMNDINYKKGILGMYKINIYYDYLKFILNVDGDCNYSNEEISNMIFNVIAVVSRNCCNTLPIYSDIKIKSLYSDFDIFNLLVKLCFKYNKEFIDDGKLECREYVLSLVFTIYSNLSLILGYKFDINNYDYQDVEEKILSFCDTFIKDKDNLESIAIHKNLNCREIDTYHCEYIAGSYYANSYIKRKARGIK